MSTAKRIISKNWIASTTNPEQKTNVSFLHYVVFTCVYLVLISPVFWTYDVFAQYEGWVQKGPSTIFIIEDQAITGIGTQIAVGESGHVMKTTDGGENWTNLVSGTTTDLHAISIPVGDIGYVVGNLGKIICTTSAGMNWFDLNSGTAKNLYGVFFTDDSTGTAVGENGTIIKTTDWGTTWNPQNSGINKILYDVYAIDQQKAVAVGAGGIILRTENGGADWSQQVSGTTEDLLAVDGHGDNKLIVSGNKGVILHSISAGMTWTPRVSGTLVHLPDVILLDEPFAAVVGHDGTILRTKDGGITWVPQESGTTENLLSVAFYDKNHGSAAGENGTVLYTRTGGKTLPIIFVDNSKPNGNGRFTNPFDNLADALNAADSTRAVWVSKGSGVYAGGMTLKERQTVLGQGVDLKYGNEILIPAATAPIITNQNGDGVRLGKKTMLEGFQIDNCNGAGIFVGPDVVDTVLVANTTITRGKRGIEIDGSSGKLIFSNVDIVKMDGPSFRLLDSGGLGTNSADVTFTGQITQSTSAATVEIQDHRGTVNFTAGSTINASNGNGLQFNNADGKYSFIGLSVLNKGHGRIEIIGGSSGTFTFDDLTITDSRDVGIRIDGSDGVFEFGKVSISNTDSVAVSIRNSSADVTFKKLDIDSALVGVKIDSLAGKFAITGDGTLGSGGRIQDIIKSGMTLNNVGIAALKDMFYQNFGGNAIETLTVENLELENISVTGAQNGIYIDNKTRKPGTIIINGGSINDTVNDGLFVRNMNLFADGVIFADSKSIRGDAMDYDFKGATEAIVENCKFKEVNINSLLIELSENPGLVDSSETNILSNHKNSNMKAGSATLLIDNNIMTAQGPEAIKVQVGGVATANSVEITNNTVIADSGNGIVIQTTDSSSALVTFANNDVSAAANDFVLVQDSSSTFQLAGFAGGDAAAVAAFIQDNNVGTPSVAVNGSISADPTTSVEESDPAVIPSAFRLEQNYPNPFNPSTTIQFDLPRQSGVTLSIYNLKGQLVRTLVDGKFTAGSHKVVWDGRDERAKLVPSGLYISQLTAGAFVKQLKMLLIK